MSAVAAFACPSWPAVASLPANSKGPRTVDKTELAKLETYLRRTFNNHAISVRARMKEPTTWSTSSTCWRRALLVA